MTRLRIAATCAAVLIAAASPSANAQRFDCHHDDDNDKGHQGVPPATEIAGESLLQIAAPPSRRDALLAAIEAELRAGRAAEADGLARQALQTRPADPDYLLARGRALIALKRIADASAVLDRLLTIDPRNHAADELLRSAQIRRRLWVARAGAAVDIFPDRDAWVESQISLGRATPAGAVLFRGARAERFGFTDKQLEIELHPRLRPATYFHLAAAYASDSLLYPHHRYAIDFYQGLGAGVEASIGVRRVGFGEDIDIYTGELSKAHGKWVVSGRVFHAPSAPPGVSTALSAIAKRYVGERGSYLQAQFGRGAWHAELRTINDLEVLAATAAGGEGAVVLNEHLALTVSGGYSREDRSDRRDLRQYSLAVGLGLRF